MKISEKPKNFLPTFLCGFEIYIKLKKILKKKNEPSSLSISDIIDSKRRG